MRAIRRSVLFGVLSVELVSCGGGSAPTLTGIAVEPHSILAWPTQTFTAVGLYSDHTDGPLNADVTWSNDAWWVRLEVRSGASTLADALCTSPAPLTGSVLPQPTAANITATATVNGKTFSDAAILYCH